MVEVSKCGLCGHPMPPGEEMFQFHGYSGPCPGPPIVDEKPTAASLVTKWLTEADSLRETAASLDLTGRAVTDTAKQFGIRAEVFESCAKELQAITSNTEKQD